MASAAQETDGQYDRDAISGSLVTVVDSYMNDRVILKNALIIWDRGDRFWVIKGKNSTNKDRRLCDRPREQYQIQAPRETL